MARLFRADDVLQGAWRPSWNVAPTQGLTVAAWDAEGSRRVLTRMGWGLLAPWEKEPETAKLRPTNARCETVQASRLFGRAFAKRRCLVATDCWFEWQKVDGRKIPHALARADDAPAVLGGVWEVWCGRDGRRLQTLAVVTTPATEALAAIHDRMPLVLEEADWPVWLGEAGGDAAALMRPAAPGRIKTWRIGGAVGNPRNNGPELLLAA